MFGFLICFWIILIFWKFLLWNVLMFILIVFLVIGKVLINGYMFDVLYIIVIEFDDIVVLFCFCSIDIFGKWDSVFVFVFVLFGLYLRLKL